MYSEEQWEYLGRCAECNAPLYAKDGKLKPGCQVPDGHLCYLEREDRENGLLREI